MSIWAAIPDGVLAPSLILLVLVVVILSGGASLGIEAHGWRGFGVSPFGRNNEGHLFLKWVRLGFVSFSFNRGSLVDKLMRMMERMADVARGK
jgi:hypothetical protein